MNTVFCATDIVESDDWLQYNVPSSKSTNNSILNYVTTKFLLGAE